MYNQLGTVKLRSGETVEAGVVTGPDAAWCERIQKLLVHKGDPWNWQNTELLTHDVGLDAHFHLLHRDGVPFCNIMTVEVKGAGLFGHVWTNPQDRGQGAASQLMTLQMEHFRQRGGRALYLGTGYDSQAYHIYSRHGFASIEPGSGKMSFFSTSQDEFEADYFAAGPAEIQPLDWPHWPASAALFTAPLPALIRCTPLGLFGRCLTEGPLLPVIRQHRRAGEAPRAFSLVKPSNSAVVGLAVWSEDPLWPETSVLDVFCHPNFQDRASELFSRLEPHANTRRIVYAARQDAAKATVLQAAGYRAITTLPHWLATGTVNTSFVDIEVFARQ